MLPVIVHCSFTSPRLIYVLDWIFNEQLQTGYQLVDNKANALKYPFVISYGDVPGNSLSIPNAGLLQQTDIEEHTIATGTWKNTPVLYASPGNNYSLNFDLFSAVFFLLTRYEEYYPYPPDKHSRYPATRSILYKTGNLERPLVDEWLLLLKEELANNYPHTIPSKTFTFLPTYDIDIAYSYCYKGLLRTAGGYLRDLLSGNMQKIGERTACLKGGQDPYDSFDWLFELHQQQHIQPVYFILYAFKNTAFDKNISPHNPAMKRLIKKLVAGGTIGLHPSYYSSRDTDLIFSEKKALVATAHTPVNISRQHYIKVKIPYTYNLLLAKTITEDYSMGYPTHLGFRAGTGQSFMWYNLKGEKTTGLRVHPFCFMDTTARFECGLSPVEAFERLEKMKAALKKTGSRLITVFHNFSLGTDPGWDGWKEQYEQFIATTTAIS